VVESETELDFLLGELLLGPLAFEYPADLPADVV
jgi:hypothetical protein